MSRLVAVYGDDAELEAALGALEDAGLADNTRVVNGRPAVAEPDEVGEVVAADGARYPAGVTRDTTAADTVMIPPVVAGGSGVPPLSTPLPVRASAVRGVGTVGVVGDGPGDLGITRDLERLTGGNAEETRFYTDVLGRGGSLLVVEGEDQELTRAESALAQHEGQGLVRH